jgi:hypothetical protein
MSVADVDTLRADLHQFSLAVNTKPFNVFYYKSPHMLEYMLEPGYFNSIHETSIRVHDRIEVVANAGGEAEYASMVVSKITATGTHKEIEVSLLFCNK